LVFTRQCRRLMSDPKIRETLVRNSLQLVRESYHTGIALHRLRECCDTLSHTTMNPDVPVDEKRH
jgi:hypothetical protein